jgi:hypothetical protein
LVAAGWLPNHKPNIDRDATILPKLIRNLEVADLVPRKLFMKPAKQKP